MQKNPVSAGPARVNLSSTTHVSLHCGFLCDSHTGSHGSYDNKQSTQKESATLSQEKKLIRIKGVLMNFFIEILYL